MRQFLVHVGISHLCITSIDNKLLGIVTRRSLLTPPSHHLDQPVLPTIDDIGPIISPSPISSEPCSPSTPHTSQNDDIIKQSNYYQKRERSSSYQSHLSTLDDLDEIDENQMNDINSSYKSLSQSLTSNNGQIADSSSSFNNNSDIRIPIKPTMKRQQTALQRIAKHTSNIK